MTRPWPLAVVFAAALGACELWVSNCAEPGSYRCTGNRLQVCTILGNQWEDRQACGAGLRCLLPSAGPGPLVLEAGCYPPSDTCLLEGETRCDRPSVGDLLYTCARASGDAGLAWRATSCAAQVPAAACYSPPLSPAGQASPACLKVVGSCPEAAEARSVCEGTDLLECTLTVGDQLVYAWRRTPCAEAGLTCRRVQPTQVMCASP